MTWWRRVGNCRTICEWRRQELNWNVAEMLCRYSHLRVTFRTNCPLTKLAWNATRTENSELCAKTQEAKFSLLDVFFDVNSNRKTFELCFSYHWSNMHDFFKCQRQPVCLKLVSPLMLVKRILRPSFHRTEIRRWRWCLHSRSHWNRLRVCRLSWLRSWWRHWMAVAYFEALTTDNRVTAIWRWSRLTLCREIVSFFREKFKKKVSFLFD